MPRSAASYAVDRSSCRGTSLSREGREGAGGKKYHFERFDVELSLIETQNLEGTDDVDGGKTGIDRYLVKLRR